MNFYAPLYNLTLDELVDLYVEQQRDNDLDENALRDEIHQLKRHIADLEASLTKQNRTITKIQQLATNHLLD